MTMLEWDQPGSHVYQRGVDRGVLYLSDGTAVPWNGLRGVEESTKDGEVTSYYYDGLKYLETRQPGDFKAKLRAFTYPPEFEVFEGYAAADSGVVLGNQPVTEYFNLSYRTLIGNELEGDRFAYKIHLLYNLSVVADGRNYETVGDGSNLSEFGWDISGVPENFPGYRPSVHLILDSRRFSRAVFKDIEDILYGHRGANARLPSPIELSEFIESWIPFVVTDNGDGTFTATGLDQDIVQLERTLYSLDVDNAQWLGDDTYEISSEI